MWLGVIALVLVGAAPIVWPLLTPHRADDLDEARARWEAAGITSYRMSYAAAGGPAAPATTVVEVENGVVVFVSREREGVGPEPLSVDELFDYVERSAEQADSCTIEWHPDLGYPTRAGFALDNTIDGSWGISDVEVTVASS